ncbi:MAG TPA: hypothetical protein VFN55_03455 [Solirubrobacteraceae bacterium]|nr:hypothetical protein [Solirubrobacteraceae bacterium]
MRLRRAVAIAAVCGAGLVIAAPAVAAQNPIVQDCLAHRSGLTGHYTVAALRHALKVMPQYTQEYTSCPDVINRALLAALKVKGGSGSGGSGAFLPVPLLIVIAVIVIAAGGFLAQAARNRRRGGD